MERDFLKDVPLSNQDINRAVRIFLIASLVLNGSLLMLKNLKGSVTPLPGRSLSEVPHMPSSLQLAPVLPAQYPSFLEVTQGCFNPSGGGDLTVIPIIDIKAMVPASENKINWLVVTENGSRRFRVLDRSGKGQNWSISDRYYGFVKPKDKYTDLPVGKFDFKKGKQYKLEIHNGDLSVRRTPLLERMIREKDLQVSHCYGNR